MDSKLKKETDSKNKKDSAKAKQKKSTKSVQTLAKEQIDNEEIGNKREGKNEMSSREIFDRSRDVAASYKADNETENFKKSKDSLNSGFFGENYLGKEQRNKENGEDNVNLISDTFDSPSDFLNEVSGFDKQMRVLDVECADKNRKYGRMDSAEKAEKAKDYNSLSTSVKKIKLCNRVMGSMDKYLQNQSIRNSFDISGVRDRYDKIRARQDQVNFSIRRKHIEETPNGIADEVFKKLKVYADDEVNAYKGYSLGKSEMDVDV